MKRLKAAATGLRLLWRGDLPLSEAFWTWALVGGIAVNMTTSVFFLLLMLADRPMLALFVGYGLSLPYNIVVIGGGWQSAARYPGDQRLATLARILTVGGMGLLSLF